MAKEWKPTMINNGINSIADVPGINKEQIKEYEVQIISRFRGVVSGTPSSLKNGDWRIDTSGTPDTFKVYYNNTTSSFNFA